MGFEWIKEKIVDEITEIVLVFNDRGEILFANRACGELLQYGEDELLQCTMQKIFRKELQTGAGEDIPFDRKKLEDVKESAMYLKNNACIPVSIRILPTGQENVFLLLAEDITRQKNMDARIRRLQAGEESNRQIKNEFVANVTHELRTPVNGIKGHVANLLDMVEDREQHRMLEIIQSCCVNMSAIIDDILDFSKLQAGKFTIDEQEFDFFQMMDKVVSTHMAEISRKELRFNVAVDEKIPKILVGDELRLTQILNNLLSNAVKFTHVGYVSVMVNRTRQVNDEIQLFFMVKDTGIGISESERDKLFRNFSQVDASTTRKYGGTGLGLAITKQLVELMDGNIQVDSEKGKGSSFSFYVKLHTAQNYDEGEMHTEGYKNADYFVDNELPESGEGYMCFGAEENLEELMKRMEKLVLSIEMGAWDKAELLAETVKKLVEDAGDDVKKKVLRLEMSIRKENHERSIQSYEALKQLLLEKISEM